MQIAKCKNKETTEINQNALEFIGAQSEPFFLFLSYTIPHANNEAVSPMPSLPLSAQQKARPNIVVIMADDMGPKGSEHFIRKDKQGVI